MLQDLSPIQNHIISKLKNAQFLRYSELQPEKIPNDLFNYHLQYLVKKEMIVKSDHGYALSAKGIKYLADPYPGNDAITSLFKMNVITIISRVFNGNIEILNQVRASNPSYGKIGVPGGVVLKGELILSAASRKLKQETGLDALFRLVGCERRIMYKSGELFSDVVFPIAYTGIHTGEMISTDFGENIWCPTDDALLHESGEFDSIPSILIVLNAIKNKKINKLPFFFEEDIQSEIQAQ